jgi:hypothetical protein
MAVSIATVPINVQFGADEIGMSFVHLHVPITATAPFRIADSARSSVTFAWMSIDLSR